MDLSNIPTYMLREELNHREKIEKQMQIHRETLERKHRLTWLEAHDSDTNSCDLCHSMDCRIDCIGCDCEDDEYIPLFNSLLND